MNLAITCHNPVQAHIALQEQVWPLLKSALMAGHRMRVEVKRETRSLQQNARMWAMLGEISHHVISLRQR